MDKIKTITVNKGDTLSKIAQENNTTIDKIMSINDDIKDPNLILVGQQINVEMNFDDVGTSPIDSVETNESQKNINSAVDYEQYIKNNTATDSEQTSEEVQSIETQQSNGSYKPEDFNYSLEDSNILAAKAKNMGFTDDQVAIAIGISRHETGNYKHLAYGYNYGGVTGSGDLGSQGGYAKYSSKDVGMDAYLTNLKENYFDQGYNTVESMARKYLGYDDTSNWIDKVYKSMN